MSGLIGIIVIVGGPERLVLRMLYFNCCGSSLWIETEYFKWADIYGLCTDDIEGVILTGGYISLTMSVGEFA